MSEGLGITWEISITFQMNTLRKFGLMKIWWLLNLSNDLLKWISETVASQPLLFLNIVILQVEELQQQIEELRRSLKKVNQI